MSLDTVATALQRARTVFTRKPGLALQDDAPALAQWHAGTHCVTRHANGRQVVTDMPRELGGAGGEVSPGWLFRAALASCALTTLVMQAALEGIDLTRLEVDATSRSDARGLLGVAGPDDVDIDAGPAELRLRVRIAAAELDGVALRAFVARALRRSPVPQAVIQATSMALEVEAG